MKLSDQTASLTVGPEGQVEVSGVLNFNTVAKLNQEAIALLKQSHSEIIFDFQGVTQSDSAALALLSSWTSIARREKKKIRFINLSSSLLAIAKASHLDNVLPIAIERS